jgi:hypothetical protein
MDRTDRETEVFLGFGLNTAHIGRFEDHLRQTDNDIKRIKKLYGVKILFIYKVYPDSVGRLEMSAFTFTQDAGFKARRCR